MKIIQFQVIRNFMGPDTTVGMDEEGNMYTFSFYYGWKKVELQKPRGIMKFILKIIGYEK